MDEQRVSRLFHDAVSDLPPASFGHAEVVTASRRITAVRRTTFLGGAMLGVGVLAGTLVAGGLLDASRLPGRTSSAEQPDAPVVGPGAVDTFSSPPADQSDRAESAPGGRETPGGWDTGGWDTRGQDSCGPVDAELAGELIILLAERGTPAVGPAREVFGAGASRSCPAGSRAAAVPVAGGILYIVLVPQADLFPPGETATPDGTRGYTVTLDSGPPAAGTPATGTPSGGAPAGGQLAVVLMPAVPGQPGPLADDVPELAREMAARR